SFSDKMDEYFDRKSSEWSIRDFLNECEVEPLKRKIDSYIKCLGKIVNRENRWRGEDLLAPLSFKTAIDLTPAPLGTGNLLACLLFKTGGKPDRQQAKEWDEERHKRRSTSVHFHNPSFGIMTINGGAGTIEGGTFAGLSISKKRNQGDGQKDLEQASPYVMLSYMAMQRPFLIIDSFFFKNSRKRNKLISNDQINEDQGQSSSNDDESDVEPIDDEIEIRNKLLKILVARQEKDTKSGKIFMTSIHLNGILDFSENVMHEKIKKSLDIGQFTWLEGVLRRKTWNPIPEFSQYINQFTEDECTRAKIPTIIRKSCIIGRFDPSYYEAHDVAQQILTHFSVRLEAPIRVESKSLDLERTYAIDTTVYILNRLFRMHQDVLDVGWIELTTPDTKQHKIDGIFKAIKTTQKSQAIIIVEFSFARNAPEAKENGDQIKLCRNSMRILNKVLLQGVPKDKARVYLIQAVNGYIIIKYLVRPLPSIYILQQFICIKIPVSFDDFEQFAKDMADLMSWQADVLSTIKGINKSTTKDNHVHTTTVQDTPAKSKKAEEHKPSFPKSPCPGGSPSKLPSLI
ncbi:2598_t:CDS:2, partial [Funneliformis geosporum]